MHITLTNPAALMAALAGTAPVTFNVDGLTDLTVTVIEPEPPPAPDLDLPADVLLGWYRCRAEDLTVDEAGDVAEWRDSSAHARHLTQATGDLRVIDALNEMFGRAAFDCTPHADASDEELLHLLADLGAESGQFHHALSEGLRAKRFDYMPRGVYEAANEQRANAADRLATISRASPQLIVRHSSPCLKPRNGLSPRSAARDRNMLTRLGMDSKSLKLSATKTLPGWSVYGLIRLSDASAAFPARQVWFNLRWPLVHHLAACSRQ